MKIPSFYGQRLKFPVWKNVFQLFFFMSKWEPKVLQRRIIRLIDTRIEIDGMLENL